MLDQIASIHRAGLPSSHADSTPDVPIEIQLASHTRNIVGTLLRLQDLVTRLPSRNPLLR